MCCQINVHNLCSTSGVLKILELVLGITCLACTYSAVQPPITRWLLFGTVICLMVTLLRIFNYLLTRKEAGKFPYACILTELVATCIMTCEYLSGFIVLLMTGALGDNVYRSLNLGAACVALITAIVYGADSIFLLKQIKKVKKGKDNVVELLPMEHEIHETSKY